MRNEIIKKGQIYFPYKGLVFNVCEITERFDGQSYSFQFRPNYKIIDLIPADASFEGIQGLDLDLRKETYERNGIPTFVSERIPPSNREELYKLLEKYGLKYWDPFDLLVIEDQKYCGDNLFVRKYQNPTSKNISFLGTTNLYASVKDILQNIASGNQITIDNQRINDKEVFVALYPIYLNLYTKKVNEQLKSASKRTYSGRKPISINQKDFCKIREAYLSKRLTADESAKMLGVSRRTFYRMMESAKTTMPTNGTDINR